MTLNHAVFGGTESGLTPPASQFYSTKLHRMNCPHAEWSETGSTNDEGVPANRQSSKAQTNSRRVLLGEHWMGRQPMHPPRPRRTVHLSQDDWRSGFDFSSQLCQQFRHRHRI